MGKALLPAVVGHRGAAAAATGPWRTPPCAARRTAAPRPAPPAWRAPGHSSARHSIAEGPRRTSGRSPREEGGSDRRSPFRTHRRRGRPHCRATGRAGLDRPGRPGASPRHGGCMLVFFAVGRRYFQPNHARGAEHGPGHASGRAGGTGSGGPPISPFWSTARGASRPLWTTGAPSRPPPRPSSGGGTARTSCPFRWAHLGSRLRRRGGRRRDGGPGGRRGGGHPQARCSRPGAS